MTKIEWCDETINPIVGCTKISEGCRFCFAEKMAWRLKCMGHKKYQDVVDENGWTGKIGVDMSVFDRLPKTPKKIFVGSMCDLFHDNITEKQISSVFAYMAYDQYAPLAGLFNKRLHTYLLLTKRPKRILNASHPEHFARWPNIWLGITAENQNRYDERWTIASKIPAAVKFVSIEPALEYINIDIFAPWPDWVIWGPENGPGKRPFKDEWAVDVFEQCREKNIPFFDKRPNYLAREYPT